MRLATIVDDGRQAVALVRDDRCLPLAGGVATSIRSLAAAGSGSLERIEEWAAGRHGADWRSLDEVRLAAVVPDPGAIYTIGRNYRSPEDDPGAGPDRPLVYGKASSAVSGAGAGLAWDRSLTAAVDAECELALVIGARPDVVFGYTIINDVSSRDPWLDGDQWLLGKSMPGFCPAGPWLVTPDELDPSVTPVRLGCTINGDPIQDGSTRDMRFPIDTLLAFLGRHVELRPGDLIATGTPARLDTPPGPDRHLEPGDVVTAWIEGIGELITTIG
jgi:2-keto-4-pentenoate hydratase/2-oxohepta-3-ene-1,7-dioic acid hydratase in catechol pathway